MPPARALFALGEHAREQLGDVDLVAFCDQWLERRVELVHEAEHQLAWFAEVPKRALQSGLRAALGPR